jgi:hypothetical protein
LATATSKRSSARGRRNIAEREPHLRVSPVARPGSPQHRVLRVDGRDPARRRKPFGDGGRLEPRSTFRRQDDIVGLQGRLLEDELPEVALGFGRADLLARSRRSSSVGSFPDVGPKSAAGTG